MHLNGQMQIHAGPYSGGGGGAISSSSYSSSSSSYQGGGGSGYSGGGSSGGYGGGSGYGSGGGGGYSGGAASEADWAGLSPRVADALNGALGCVPGLSRSMFDARAITALAAMDAATALRALEELHRTDLGVGREG
jgi:hypothetical protein